MLPHRHIVVAVSFHSHGYRGVIQVSRGYYTGNSFKETIPTVDAITLTNQPITKQEYFLGTDIQSRTYNTV